MNTKLKRLQRCMPRRCKISSAISAALLGVGLAASQCGVAQEMVEGPVILHGAKPGTAAMALPLRGPDCQGDINVDTNVVVPVGKSTLVQLAEPTRNRTLGNPAVVMATLVSPRTLYVVGMSVGTTNMIVEGSSGECEMLEVIVGVDASGLQQSLAELLPEETGIRVTSAAGNLVLAGHISSASAAQQAMEIAQAYAKAQPTEQSQKSTSSSTNGAMKSSEMSSTSARSNVINMMTVDAPQQVMLEVKVAEVAKTLIEQLGSQVNLQGGIGTWTAALASSLLTGAQTIAGASKANNLPLSASIDAQKTDQLTKILAEPNLVTVSGQEASFLAGGRVFIPVPQSSGNTTTVTLQEEEFGVALKFTPTVLGNGRINLKVAPEVSELSPTGVTVSATGTSTTAILPLINTRRASTTVQMNDGESFAIGGLIGNNVTGTLKAFPGLGELPVIGALLRSTSFQQDKTELLFIVTPHLVKPMPNSNYRLPTDSFRQPNQVDVYATGNMEGRGAKLKRPQPSPAGIPGDSSMLQPSQTGSGTATPSPTPTRPSTGTPDETAFVPRESSQSAGEPMPVVSSRELPLDSKTVRPPSNAPAASSVGQAARIARIEATAARIAKAAQQPSMKTSSTPSQSATR